MIKSKRYFSIERALEEIPRNEWSSHHDIYKEMQTCTRLTGIIRNHIMKGGVTMQCFDDISSEVLAILQMKMLEKLDEPKSFYYVGYRVAQLVVSSYRKRDFNTFFSSEVSFDAPIGLGKDGDESEGFAAILTNEATLDDFSNDVIHQVDLHNAKTNLAKKLSTLGWPSDIPKEHKRIGRPKKNAA
jgi:hypothetical protein